jgi:hypothetical protein
MPRFQPGFLVSALAALVLSTLSTGCNWLDGDDPLSFSVPITIPLPGPLPIQYPDENLYPNPEWLDNDRDRGRTAIAIPLPAAVDIPSFMPGGVSNNQVITRVDVDNLLVTVEDNTLNIPIEPFEVRVGIEGQRWREMTPAARTEQVAPGVTGEVPGSAVEDNRIEVGELLASGEARMRLGTEWVLNEGDPPSGRARVRGSLRLRVRVSPLGAVGGLSPNFWFPPGP